MVVNKTESILLRVFWKTHLNNLIFLFKKICIASDHGGYTLKESIKDLLIKKNMSIIDLGPFDSKTVDYPDFAKKLANRIKDKKSDVGILICGSGTGASGSTHSSSAPSSFGGFRNVSTIASPFS